MANALPSQPPPAETARPRYLRAVPSLRAGNRPGTGPRGIHERRDDARIDGAAEIAAACARFAVTDRRLANAFYNKNDAFGAKVKAASANLGDGEVSRLAPVLVAAFVELARIRHVIGRMAEIAPKAAELRLSMASQHISLVETLLFSDHEQLVEPERNLDADTNQTA